VDTTSKLFVGSCMLEPVHFECRSRRDCRDERRGVWKNISTNNGDNHNEPVRRRLASERKYVGCFLEGYQKNYTGKVGPRKKASRKECVVRLIILIKCAFECIKALTELQLAPVRNLTPPGTLAYSPFPCNVINACAKLTQEAIRTLRTLSPWSAKSCPWHSEASQASGQGRVRAEKIKMD